MTVVLDASAGIEIALDKENAEKFRIILEKASKVITSDLYKAETTNIIWKYHKAGLLNKEKIIQTMKYCDNLIDDYIDIAEYNEEALFESIRLNHSTYDLLYFILARRNGAVLLSLDKKLNEIAKSNGIEIIL